MAKPEPPRPISVNDDCSGFGCGKPVLDIFLKERAVGNEGKYSRTYVVCVAGEVAGYYTLSTAGVLRSDVPGRLKRNAPETVPVVLVGRLAVDSRYHGQGIGSGLLRDALKRSLQLSQIAGCRAVMVHALDAEAADFYRSYGFAEFPGGSMTFFLPLETVAAAL